MLNALNDLGRNIRDLVKQHKMKALILVGKELLRPALLAMEGTRLGEQLWLALHLSLYSIRAGRIDQGRIGPER